jgi:hypothetical protein
MIATRDFATTVYFSMLGLLLSLALVFLTGAQDAALFQ